MKLGKDQATLKQVAKVVGYAFLKKDDLTQDTNFLTRYHHSQGYGEFHDGQLASYIMANQFKSQLFATQVKMAGVGYVASLPEFRGQGDIKRLMEEMLADLHQGGYAISNLAPFSKTFYRQFGYENSIFQQKLKMTEESLRFFKAVKNGKVLRGSWTDSKLQEAVLAIYAQVLKENQRNTVVREKWWWERLEQYYPDRHLAVYFDQENRPQGYVFYRIIERRFIVQEIVYLNVTAAKALLSLIGAHTGQDFVFEFILQEDANLLELFPEHMAIKVEQADYMMSRIIDVEKVLACQKLLAPTSCVIEVTADQICPWNNGKYELSYQADCLNVKPTQKEADYSGNITAWTKVLLGHLDMHSAIALGEIKQNSDAGLEFKKGKVSFYDYF